LRFLSSSGLIPNSLKDEIPIGKDVYLIVNHSKFMSIIDLVFK